MPSPRSRLVSGANRRGHERCVGTAPAKPASPARANARHRRVPDGLGRGVTIADPRRSRSAATRVAWAVAMAVGRTPSAAFPSEDPRGARLVTARRGHGTPRVLCPALDDHPHRKAPQTSVDGARTVPRRCQRRTVEGRRSTPLATFGISGTQWAAGPALPATAPSMSPPIAGLRVVRLRP